MPDLPTQTKEPAPIRERETLSLGSKSASPDFHLPDSRSRRILERPARVKESAIMDLQESNPETVALPVG